MASTVTTIRSRGESRNGVAVKVVIGMVHCLLVTIVEDVPSQVVVIGLNVPSWALKSILYSVIV